MPKRPSWNDTRGISEKALVRPPRFEEWLDVYFRPYDGVDSPWDKFPPYGGDEGPIFEGTDEEIAELFIYTMLSSGSELSGLTGQQLGNGLGNLLCNTFADVADTVRSGQLAEGTKISAIQSIGVLYRDCLTPRAPPVLGHRNEHSACEPISYVTYMLWDASPLAHGSKTIWPTILSVMEGALYSPNPAVVESGLHGLGHTVFRMGEAAVAPIDTFLTRRRGQVRDELIEYASCARTGRIQ